MRELKRGRVRVVAAFEQIDGAHVHLADGTAIEPEAVIAATGYERGRKPLVGHLGVLAADGVPRPRSKGGADLDAPHLHFIGFLNDFNSAIWAPAWEARRVSRTIDHMQRATAHRRPA